MGNVRPSGQEDGQRGRLNLDIQPPGLVLCVGIFAAESASVGVTPFTHCVGRIAIHLISKPLIAADTDDPAPAVSQAWPIQMTLSA